MDYTGRCNGIGEGQAARYITRECIKSLRRLARSLKNQLASTSKLEARYHHIMDEYRSVQRDYRSYLRSLSSL